MVNISECTMCPWKKTFVFSSYYVFCSIHINYFKMGDRFIQVFHVFILFPSFSINCWKKDIGIFSSDCGIFYLAYSLFQFLLHTLWSSVIFAPTCLLWLVVFLWIEIFLFVSVNTFCLEVHFIPYLYIYSYPLRFTVSIVYLNSSFLGVYMCLCILIYNSCRQTLFFKQKF